MFKSNKDLGRDKILYYSSSLSALFIGPNSPISTMIKQNFPCIIMGNRLQERERWGTFLAPASGLLSSAEVNKTQGGMERQGQQSFEGSETTVLFSNNLKDKGK